MPLVPAASRPSNVSCRPSGGRKIGFFATGESRLDIRRAASVGRDHADDRGIDRRARRRPRRPAGTTPPSRSAASPPIASGSSRRVGGPHLGVVARHRPADEQQLRPIGSEQRAGVERRAADDRPCRPGRRVRDDDIAVHAVGELAVGGRSERGRQPVRAAAGDDDRPEGERHGQHDHKRDGPEREAGCGRGPRRDRRHGDPPFGDAPGRATPGASGPREDLAEQGLGLAPSGRQPTARR